MEANEQRTGAAPGWYDNPDGPGLRYYDGQNWTGSYHPGHQPSDSASFGEVLWGLALGFGLAGGGAALVGIPVLAFYFPLGLGAAGLGLAIAAAIQRGPTPWWAVVAVLGSLGALGSGIDGYNEFSDASNRLNDLGV